MARKKSPSKPYRILGQVIDKESRQGLAGLKVEAWDKDLIINDLVGSATTDEQGHFEIKFDATYFQELFLDRKPDLFFKVYRGDELLLNTQDAMVCTIAPGDTNVTLEVELSGGEPEEKPKVFVVRGRVVSHELVGLAGLPVIAVDKNVGQDVELGKALTEAKGAYRIQYEITSLQKRGKEKPDLQIKVAAAEDEKQILAASTVRYNAGSDEIIDIMVPADKLQRPAEYQRVTSDLLAHLGPNAQLGGLREDDERQDITYLANKTGWDARMVAMVALANQFSEQSDVHPELFYALFRVGLPANEAVLRQMEPATVLSIWEKSIEAKVITPDLKDQLPQNLEHFKAWSAGQLLEGPASIGVSSLKELVDLSFGADDESKQRFAQLYYDNRRNLSALWERVSNEFGAETANRLQLNGKLAFLTVNNAPLITRLYQNYQLSSPLNLVQRGLFRSEAWAELLTEDDAIPNEIPGTDAAEKKANYAKYMASQLRLSYPTAVVAEMINSDEIPLHTPQPVKASVYQFLAAQQGKFELGIHPVEYYLRQQNLELDNEVLGQVKRLQRVYQISTSDEAMGKLIEHNIDSAYAVIQYDEQGFVKKFKDTLGDEAMARLTYAKAHQVHHAVLNIATSYLLDRGAPSLYAITAPPETNGVARTTLALTAAEDDPGVIAYPTLEGLFGEMDYCACEHCRSVLSPAAYLVDLLKFIDLPDEDTNPLDVLIGRHPDILGRRPDIQHLQLTCENTNTVLPYIDLVNEILEYFVVNGVDNSNFSLEGFEGYNIEEGITTEELLANPQFVKNEAYNHLMNQVFPLTLPFYQRLEALRRYFNHFEVPLQVAMEKLRKDDNLEVATGASATEYAWQDILIERLQLTRKEYDVLTDSTIPLEQLYGVDITLDLVNELSNVKTFARRVGITYEELIDITRTRFINPNSYLLPKLEKLGVNFKNIADFNDGTLSEDDFAALLPNDLDPVQYGGNAGEDAKPHVMQWIRTNFDQIIGLIVLSDPTGSEDICGFEKLEFRYASPDFDNNQLQAVEFLKLLRFIRLWRKLGWTIAETDKTIAALYPLAQLPAPGDNEATIKTKLDAGFESLIIRIAHLKAVMEMLNLNAKKDLAPLLACWSSIDTNGYRSLYRQMFLNPTILKLDAVFQEDGYGNYLQDSSQKIVVHAEALRAAFNLTQEELSLILQELTFDELTPLFLDNISAIFRHGFLAKKLKFSVRELLALKGLSGLDPFQPLDLVQPPDPTQPFGAVRPDMIKFIELARLIKDSSFKISQLLYFLKHEDQTGKASPEMNSILAYAKTLRDDLLRIERENVVQDDPTGEVARAKMALVYGSEVTDTFFGLLNATSVYTVEKYDHGSSELEADVLAITDRIGYDNFQKQLSFRGVMTEAVKTALDSAASATGDFRAAVQELFDNADTEFRNFFDRFPDLEVLYNNFDASNDAIEIKMAALLADFLPALRQGLKRQQVRQTISSQVDAELSLVNTLLETPELLHAIELLDEPVVADFLNLQTQGVSVDYFYAEDVLGPPDLREQIVAGINYSPDGTTLPENTMVAGANISGVWRFYLEAPDNGFFNFYVEAETDSEVELSLEKEPVTLSRSGNIWENTEAIELKAGKLYAMQLTVKKVKNKLVLKWESRGLAKESIPAAYLYPAVLVERFTGSYLRLLKVFTIVEELNLSAAEVAHFAAHADYHVNGEGWLNALPVEESSVTATTQALMASFSALLRFAQLKAYLKVRDESLIQIFENPAATTEDGKSLLAKVTGWGESDLEALLLHFSLAESDLAHLHHFIRIQEAFVLIKKLGILADTLLASTTNGPTVEIIRDLQSALRARYEDSAWLKVLQPINDELRSLQRDALVAFVLHKLQQEETTAHIDTPDKLFEYFLIDVQMDPCMKTSRIKQALSSVQLFIQRCLMNLETQVAASSINAKQWEWMKRYRVWEANRKVFLFPENWLEPELRDDKSPFFKDLESELLQSDITDDAAATALVHYLEKLEEVAKLEICGMYLLESEIDNNADDVIHVIARTAGARRTYYYRRLEGSYWTPWEKVDVKIEDNPVLPVVWKGRLFLFWLSVMQEGAPSEGESANSDKELVDASVADLKGLTADPKVRVKVTLYWSEYLNGKWQPPKTSDVNRPIDLGEFDPTGGGAFDRTLLTMSSSETIRGELRIYIEYPTKPRSFTLYNTHSLPVRGEDDVDSSLALHTKYYFRSFARENGLFIISYDCIHSLVTLFSADLEVLRNVLLYEIIEPRQYVNDLFEAPFFFQDHRHVFFVRSVKSQTPVADFSDAGIIIAPPAINIYTEPPLIVMPDFAGFILPEEIVFPPESIRPGIVDLGPVQNFLNQSPYIRQAMGTGGTVPYGNKLIGPGGFVPDGIGR